MALQSRLLHHIPVGTHSAFQRMHAFDHAGGLCGNGTACFRFYTACCRGSAVPAASILLAHSACATHMVVRCYVLHAATI